MAAQNILKNTSTQIKNTLTGAKNALGNVPGIGGALIDVGGNVFANMLNGDNFGTALAKGIPEAVAWAVAPGFMGTLMAAQMVPALATGYMAANNALKGKYNQNHAGGPMFSYKDSRQALTMRQAAVQAIQGSKMNARNALGGEAALMHRNWADRM